MRKNSNETKIKKAQQSKEVERVTSGDRTMIGRPWPCQCCCWCWSGRPGEKLPDTSLTGSRGRGMEGKKEGIGLKWKCLLVLRPVWSYLTSCISSSCCIRDLNTNSEILSSHNFILRSIVDDPIQMLECFQ